MFATQWSHDVSAGQLGVSSIKTIFKEAAGCELVG